MGVTLFIVRHGNTFETGEPPRRIGSRTDLPLVQSGRLQATELGRWFDAKGIRFDGVLTSPLSRTRETAALILAQQARAPEMVSCDWLAEIDHGPDENQSEATVVGRIGADALSAWETEGIPPQGWSVDTEARRAAWQRLFDEQSGGPERTLLLVTSNGAARFALLAAPALREQAKALTSLKLRTGAYGQIRVTADGPRLAAWDRRPEAGAA